MSNTHDTQPDWISSSALSASDLSTSSMYVGMDFADTSVREVIDQVADLSLTPADFFDLVMTAGQRTEPRPNSSILIIAKHFDLMSKTDKANIAAACVRAHRKALAQQLQAIKNNPTTGDQP